jgi:C1A family cysteine protease
MDSNFKTPRSILNYYKKGFTGAICDELDVKKLLGELPMPVFGAAAYDLFGSGEGKLSLPFKCLMEFDPGFGPAERQTTGDCVSHSTRNAIDVTRAVEIKNGENEDWLARGATEAIYQSRGHRQQGMTCSGATRYVYENGGILVRKDYGDVDLSVYNSGLGANHRIPDSIYKTEAKKHQVKTVSNVRTVEEARDALANGYALSVCSGYGFSSRRDANGIAKRGSGWSHAMAWIACDDTRERLNETLFLVQNSWGMWNAGPKVHGQPDGSFWIREQDARGMLSGGGAWVYSDVDGFPPRDIKYTIDEVF